MKMSDSHNVSTAELRLSLFPPRTENFVETLIREGDNFDYRTWLRRVREEEAQAKQVPVAFSSGEAVAFEMGDLTNTPDRLDARTNEEPVLQAKSAPIPMARYRSDQKAREKGSRDRLGQRLVLVCHARDDFQECRARDAVYGYLKAVFALVVDCKGRRRTKRLLRRAFQFAGLPFDKNADPFAAVIRCTSERAIDNKTISKWARALRYAARCKKPRARLRTFIKKNGRDQCLRRAVRNISWPRWPMRMAKRVPVAVLNARLVTRNLEARAIVKQVSASPQAPRKSRIEQGSKSRPNSN